MRLIDADALMKEFAEYVRESNNSDFADVPTWNDAVSLLGSAPTIEAEPVIRCKDCKCMGMLTKNTLGDILGCYDGECGMLSLYVKDNDFCIWGERREDG